MIDKAAMVLCLSTEPKPYMCILFLSTVHCLNVKVLESSTFPCGTQERGGRGGQSSHFAQMSH